MDKCRGCAYQALCQQHGKCIRVKACGREIVQPETVWIDLEQANNPYLEYLKARYGQTIH